MKIVSEEFIVLFHCKDLYRGLYSHIYKYKLIICYTISWSCDLSFTKIVCTTCFPEVHWFEFWTCFLEVHWNWILDVLPRGSMELNFGRTSQRFDGIEFWMCFPKVHWFEILNMLPRGPLIWNFKHTSQRSKDWNFGCASQRSDGFEVWTCFPKVWWIWNFGYASQRSKDLNFGCASQRSNGFLEGIILANMCGPFTLVPTK